MSSRPTSEPLPQAGQWHPSEVAAPADALDMCVYASRLIGSDPALVLHGGGNSSVKAPFDDITGEQVDAVWVKGSGWDMGTIERAGFAALRMTRLARLLELDVLSDVDMAREFRAAKLDPAHPDPSVESLLHAFLPFRSVLHSHADAIITLTDTADADRYVAEVFGSDVLVIPYVMPGFDLARRVARDWRRHAHGSELGMVLMNHGLFTFGDDARTAFERHVELIARADAWLAMNAPWAPAQAADPATDRKVDWRAIADVRAAISRAAGRPMIVRHHDDPTIRRFIARDDLAEIAGSGPLTPDHVIRTKRLPLVGRDVDAYVADYERYVDEHRERKSDELESIDPAPRVVLDPALGMLTAGETWSSASIADDVYRQTIPVIERTTDHLGGYVALPAEHIFDVEYWDLQQAKLRSRASTAESNGRVAVVTAATSAIGRASATELARLGALVIGVDVAESVEELDLGPGFLGIRADLADAAAALAVVERAVMHAGGVDVAVLVAGTLGSTDPMHGSDLGAFCRHTDSQVAAAARMMVALQPVLARSPVGGRAVAVATAEAVSPSAATLVRLVEVVASDWHRDAINVNGVRIDAVAEARLRGAPITSADIATTVVALTTDRFGATTGTTVPIDVNHQGLVSAGRLARRR